MRSGKEAPDVVILNVSGVRHRVPATQRIKFLADAKDNNGSEAGRRYAKYSQASTLGEALSLGAVQGDINHDLKKGFLTVIGWSAHKLKKAASRASSAFSSRRAKPELPDEYRAGLVSVEKALKSSCSRTDKSFQHVISLGSRCLVARTIDNMSLRRYCGPFDWIYTSAEMVKDCFENDFKKFLDRSQVVRSGVQWGHKHYSKMLGRGIIWPHHEPRVKDRILFERAVTRLRQIVASSERKLLILAQVMDSARDLGKSSSTEDAQKLFDYLRKTRSIKNFHLLVINVVKENASLAGKSPLVRLGVTGGSSAETLSTMDLHCLGDCTGVRFKRPADDKALRALIAGDGCAKAGRRFDLLPDPLPPRQGVVAKKNVRLGEVAPSLPNSSVTSRQRAASRRATRRSPLTIAAAAAAAKRRRQRP